VHGTALESPPLRRRCWLREQSFKQPALPFVVDIGSAKGTASSTLAELNPQQNVLGLEIRRPMVTLAMQRKQAKGLENLHYLASNVNIDLDRILTDIHKESHVDLVTIHFPDPHFKKKNAKRRIVTPQLVQTMARHLRPGTLVSMRSDVIEVLEEMHEFFKTSGAFNFAGEDDKDFAKNSPVPAVKTEREIVTEAKGAPVYRTLFKRSS